MQLAIFAASQRADFFDGFVYPLQQLAHFIQEKLPLRREYDAAWAAFHQVHADLIFQISHLPAQRRLSDSQPRGRFGEVQRFRHCQKISQMPQFHRSRALCRKGIAAQATWYWADSSTWGKMGADD